MGLFLGAASTARSPIWSRGLGGGSGLRRKIGTRIGTQQEGKGRDWLVWYPFLPLEKPQFSALFGIRRDGAGRTSTASNPVGDTSTFASPARALRAGRRQAVFSRLKFGVRTVGETARSAPDRHVIGALGHGPFDKRLNNQDYHGPDKAYDAKRDGAVH